MVRQLIHTVKIFCDNPIHEDTKAENGTQCVSREKSRTQAKAKTGKPGGCSGPSWVPAGEISQVSQGGKFHISRNRI